MNKKIVRITALFVLMSASLFAQKKEVVLPVSNELDEVVVSDSKFVLAKEKSGKVIVKITADDLKKRPGQSVASVLNTVAGIEINGSQSNAGKNLGYYVRGGRNRQTLILIDGIPVTDASNINLEYDLRLIPVEQVESIEIMKGAASTLYGSGAATGVINITLKKAEKKAIAGNAYVSLGTQTDAKSKDYSVQDFNQGFSFNGKAEKFNYFASLNSVETTGISEARPASDADTFEDDSFSRINGLIKLGFTPTKKLSFDFFVNYDRLKNDFDADSFTDDVNNYGKSEQYRVGFSPKYKYDKGELVVNAAASLMNRESFSYSSLTEYKSRNVSVDAFNKYQIVSDLFIVTGAQFQFFDMSTTSMYTQLSDELAKFNLIDPYVTAVYNSDFGLNINTGARLNVHSKYGSNFVYNINPSFSFSEIPLKLITSYSTAYITPSLYQLYSSYGNLDLTPEKNSTLEAGFEVALLDKKINFNAVAFYRQEDNSIGFTSKYYNIEGKNNARGVETMLSYTLTDKLRLNGNYTFTQVEEALSIRIPKHKGNAAVDFQATARTFFNVSYQYVDQRSDSFYDPITFTPSQVTLKSYQLLNATARYELVKNRMTIFATATNILNEDFYEVVGYTTRGRNFKLGLNFNF